MGRCGAARTPNHRRPEPPPSFAWGDPLCAIAPFRRLPPSGCIARAITARRARGGAAAALVRSTLSKE